MSVLQDAREVIAGKLTAAGVESVTLDPSTVAPFVLVGPPTVTGAVGVGGWSITQPIVVATPPPGNAAALAWQLAQVELVMVELGVRDAVPGLYDPAGKALPAYTVTVPADVTRPDC